MKTTAVASLALISALAGAAHAGVLTGTATYRERMALPPDATFEVMLQDVSLAGAPAKIIGRSILDPAGQPPFHFGIAYQDMAIQHNHRYAVRAVVRHRGTLLFTTDTHVAAFNGSGPLSIQMVRVASTAVAGKQSESSPLLGTYWKLVELHGKPAVVLAEQRREPHIRLSASEPRMTGHGGCNGVGGNFELQDQQLRFTGLMGTMMACPEPDAMQQESSFLQTLGTVRRFRIEGRHLVLINEAGAAVVRLVADSAK
jgi:putative lipoprotein